MGFVAGTLRCIDESNTNWMAMLNFDVDLLQYLVWEHGKTFRDNSVLDLYPTHNILVENSRTLFK